jgi:hypothetical protein
MVYKCRLHTYDLFQQKTTDIVTSHVILQQFCMQLFSFMAGLKHQENLTELQITASAKMENNTTAD